MTPPIIEITCSDNGKVARADVLERSNTRIKVAMGVGGSSTTLTLTKTSAKDKVFIGSKFGMEFTTTGKEI